MSIDFVTFDVDFYAQQLVGKCIGFGGKLGSGKTYLSNALVSYIRNHSSVTAIRRSFGDELRNFVEQKIGIPVSTFKHRFTSITKNDRVDCVKKIRSHVDDMGLVLDNDFLVERYNRCQTYNDLYRASLQLVGTELYRQQVDNDIWANSVGKTLDTNVITVIDDIRFVNELSVVRSNGISVYVVSLDLVEGESDALVQQHASETSIGGADFELVYYNMIKDSMTTDQIGKAVFNQVVPFYYTFKAMKDDPNNEKILRSTIKRACN